MKKIIFNKKLNIPKYVIETRLPFLFANKYDYLKYFGNDISKGFLNGFKGLLEAIEDNNLEFIEQITEKKLYNRLEKELNLLTENNCKYKIDNYESLENLDPYVDNGSNINNNNFFDNLKMALNRKLSWNDNNVLHYVNADNNLKLLCAFNGVFGASIDRSLNSAIGNPKNSYFNQRRIYYTPNGLSGIFGSQSKGIIVCRCLIKTDAKLQIINKETEELDEELNSTEKIDFCMDNITKTKLKLFLPEENIEVNEDDNSNYYLVQFESYEDNYDWVITDFNGILNTNPFHLIN